MAYRADGGQRADVVDLLEGAQIGRAVRRVPRKALVDDGPLQGKHS